MSTEKPDFGSREYGFRIEREAIRFLLTAVQPIDKGPELSDLEGACYRAVALIESLQAQLKAADELATAMKIIQDWRLPATNVRSCTSPDHTEGDHGSGCIGLCHELSYEYLNGSNGARSYIRQVAATALAAYLRLREPSAEKPEPAQEPATCQAYNHKRRQTCGALLPCPIHPEGR